MIVYGCSSLLLYAFYYLYCSLLIYLGCLGKLILIQTGKTISPLSFSRNIDFRNLLKDILSHMRWQCISRITPSMSTINTLIAIPYISFYTLNTIQFICLQSLPPLRSNRKSTHMITLIMMKQSYLRLDQQLSNP